MPRLRNRENGAVVNVDSITAERLGPLWVDADNAFVEGATTKRGPGRPKKTEDK